MSEECILILIFSNLITVYSNEYKIKHSDGCTGEIADKYDFFFMFYLEFDFLQHYPNICNHNEEKGNGHCTAKIIKKVIKFC